MPGSLIRHAVRDLAVTTWTRFVTDVFFVHINKTGGSSIEAALRLPFQHRTAVELKTLAGGRRWSRGFSFSFVRNPWDRVASHYRYRVKTRQAGLETSTVSFTEWVCRAYGDRDPRFYDTPKMFMPQVDWIRDPEGNVMVDFVGRFERLHDDFGEVCRRVGRDAELPHLKPSGGRRPYWELYDTETREIVAERLREDIEVLGYSFLPETSD